jgi:predicted outer membrane protein
MPAGQMALQKGVDPRVRQVGRMIHDQHARLDALVVSTAARLRVSLPDEPNADQRQWLGEMGAATGRDFDRVFVARLRAAHGKVFPLIGAVRVGTRNAVVREFAQSANDYVLTHLTLLESTGLVDYAALPPPPPPAAATTSGSATSSSLSPGGGSASLVTSRLGVLALLAIALTGAAVLGRARLQRRRARIRRRADRVSGVRARRPHPSPHSGWPDRRPSAPRISP